MKTFGLNCERCGIKHSVAQARAGSTLNCFCGFKIAVPPLSQLRKSEGLDAYEMPISEKVLQLVFDDMLPTRRDCVRCGAPSAERQYIYAICERSYQQSESEGQIVGTIMGIPFYIAMPGASLPAGQHVGRDVVVPLVFNICPDCWKRSLGRGQFPGFLWAAAGALVISACISYCICLFGANLAEPHFALSSAAIFAVAAIVTSGVALSASRPRLSRLKQGLYNESVYRELFKQYLDAELFEFKAR